MKKFTFVVTNSAGIHTRHAGLVVKAATSYGDTEITITKAGNTAKASQLMKLLGPGIKQGDKVIVVAEGPDEIKAITSRENLFRECSQAAALSISTEEWIYCPKCGHKSHIKIRPDTKLKNFPPFCSTCRLESLINTLKKETEVSQQRIPLCKYGLSHQEQHCCRSKCCSPTPARSTDHSYDNVAVRSLWQVHGKTPSAENLSSC